MTNCARRGGHCRRCEGELPFQISMAFQPIVDIKNKEIYAYEALVRGVKGESAYSILNQVTDSLLYRFDQVCRVKAIELASQLGMKKPLSINFLPNAVYEPEACIQATLQVSQQVGWPIDHLIFEITETEKVSDRQHLDKIVKAYKMMGFKVAIDDFGSGYANFDLLTTLTPDKIKIDRELISHCDHDERRQVLLRTLIKLSDDLGVDVIAEGVESKEEALWLYAEGVSLQQGYFYARPTLEYIETDVSKALDLIEKDANDLSIELSGKALGLNALRKASV